MTQWPTATVPQTVTGLRGVSDRHEALSVLKEACGRFANLCGQNFV
jgi:hypothetical protein